MKRRLRFSARALDPFESVGKPNIIFPISWSTVILAMTSTSSLMDYAILYVMVELQFPLGR